MLHQKTILLKIVRYRKIISYTETCIETLAYILYKQLHILAVKVAECIAFTESNCCDGDIVP